MKCVRILVLLLATSTVAAFSIPATAQFEIDPDHFDQMATARAKGPGTKGRASRKASGTKHQQKHSQQANKHPEGTRQAKSVNQPLSAGSKGE